MVYFSINRDSLPVRAAALTAGGVSRAFLFATFFILALLVSRLAHASGDTVAEIATNIDENTFLIPDFIAYLMYIAGAAMVVWGLLDIRGYVESPTQKHLRTGLSKIGLAAFLFCLPFAADIIMDTMMGFFGRFFAHAPIIQHVDAPMAANAAGQGGFWDLVKQVTVSGNFLPSFFNYAAYIGGTGLLAYGLFALRRSVEDPGRHPIKVPVAQLFAAGLLLSVPFAASVIYYTMTYGITGEPQYVPGAYRFGEQASGGTIADVINSTRRNASVLPSFGIYLCYIIGTFFTIRAILMFKDNVADPSRMPITEPLKRMGVGGLCFGIPYAVEVITNSFTVDGADVEAGTGWAIQNAGTGGLDGMFIALAKNAVNPLLIGIEVFCYIAGFMMVVFGIQRLTQTMQQGAKGPLGFGTISMFIVAASLLSFPHFMGVLGNTVFGSTSAMTNIAFMNTGGALDDTLQQNAKNVISACIAFIGVIGYLSVVRGLFIFKAYADGGQGTLFGATVHMIAGIIAVNLGQFVNIMQRSLGLTDLGIVFS